MKSQLSKFFSFLKGSLGFIVENKTVTALLVLGGIAAFVYGINSQKADVKETITPTRGPISQTVSVTGKVEAAEDASLSFQSTGAVSFIGVKIGDKVSTGKVLATLTSGDEQAATLQAKATLENAQAILAQLVEGARPEELAIKEQALLNAQSSVESTYQTLPDAIRNVDATTADAVKNKLSSLFVYSGNGYNLSFSSCDQTLQSKVESGRSKLETTLGTFQKSVATISGLSSKSDIDSAFNEAYNAILATNELVSNISSLLLTSCSAQNTSLDAYRTSLALVRTSLNTTFADVSAKRTALSTAKNTLSQAERDLALTKAGTDQSKIRAQQAVVSQAEAGVLSAESRLAKTIIRAPFDGVITDVSLIKGETAQLGKTAITMISANAYQVTANIPEIDIAKITLGAPVDITLDAYGSGKIFKATITRINPSAFFEGNVPKYTVIATFSTVDESIKTGMTANVKVITKTVSQAVTVPVRFVEVVNETKGKITILQNGKESVLDVSLGIRTDDGKIEITEGLIGNETLVAIQPGVRSAQKQSN